MTRDASRSQQDGGSPAQSPAQGVSQLIAKIFDQLNVSAWLPATMLVGNLAVLIRLHQQGNVDVTAAARALTQSPLSVLIVMFISVVLATMVSQAFAFEVIRVLEGYWDRPHVMAWLTRVRCARHHRRYLKLQKRRRTIHEQAFAAARTAMLKKKIRRGIVDVQEDEVLKGSPAPDHSEADLADAADPAFDWHQFCPPGLLRRFESISKQIAQYPAPYRIMPTRLGNTLRSAEDRLEYARDDDLEGLVLRSYDRIPEHLRETHDQFRTRLDMYCTLVFVFFVLALSAFALLVGGRGGLPAALIVAAVYAALAWTSYNAAVASARGYGSVLVVINQQLAPEQAEAESAD